MSPSILLRVDASSTIGRGHAIRCMAIGAAFRRHGWSGHVLSRELPAPIRAQLDADGYAVDTIKPGLLPHQEPAAILDAVHRSGASGVVLDFYGADHKYLDALRRHGIHVTQFDDFTRLPPRADIVVNGNAGCTREDYGVVEEWCQVLAGTPYSVLRPDFARSRRTIGNVGSSIRTILVMLGSAAGAREYREVFHALSAVGSFRVLVVHWGWALRHDEIPHIPYAEKLALEIVSDPDGLPALMGSADLAITAGGISSLELACLGVPMLICEASPNQALNVAGLAAAGAAIDLGALQGLSAESLQSVVRELANDESRRRRMALAGPRLIDGYGADRVALAVIRDLETACQPSR